MGRQASRSTEEYWRRVIAEQKASGLTVAAFSAQRGFSKNSFYIWKKRLRSKKGAGAEQIFLPVTVRAAESAPTDAGARIEVTLPGGHLISLPLSRENFAMVVEILETRIC